MLRTVLYAKLHHPVVTQCNPDYVGSITIDQDLLDAAGLAVNEKVLVADCENGNRFETYIFSGERGSGIIGLNGAAAQLTAQGHKLIVLAFCQLDEDEMKTHRPMVLVCDERNRIARQFRYDPPLS
jgi:aspartate 1-decarboxylase